MKNKLPSQERAIEVYAEAAQTLDRWMTSSGVDGDFTACDTAVLNGFFAWTGRPAPRPQGKFWVLGNAVTIVTYDDSGEQRQMDSFNYLATVSWNNRRPRMAALPQRVSVDDGPHVVKHDPDIPLTGASALVLAGFNPCSALRVGPLPAQCMGIGNEGDHPKWTLDGNPNPERHRISRSCYRPRARDRQLRDD